jgi:hypothetical protein
MFLRIGAASLVLLLTSCAGTNGGSASPKPSPSDANLRPTSQQPVPSDPAGSQTISGRLGADSIEGGCAYLQTEAGKRYEVIYPKSWKLDKGRARLTNPQGEVVASAGDTVTVRGEIATDMASTCQIGPIFRATEVVTSGR